MFFGLMMVDAALAAWAVGLMQQKRAPRWVPLVLVLLGLTFAVTLSSVVLLADPADNELARAWGQVAPLGAVAAALALGVATVISRRPKRG
ncbi:MAG: hypothetical protein H6Q89_1345 [Myxococcaceae bacterium]|nr:hypothetical protein [Myxococcaceae bacterium]